MTNEGRRRINLHFEEDSEPHNNERQTLRMVCMICGVLLNEREGNHHRVLQSRTVMKAKHFQSYAWRTN